MDKIRYGKRPYPKMLKSKTAWAKMDREIKPGEKPVASATILLKHGEVECELWHV